MIELRTATGGENRDTVLAAKANRLLADVLAVPPLYSDQTLAYLLLLENVGGEATARHLACRGIERNSMVREFKDWLEAYQIDLPAIGVEPVPSTILADGELARSVLESLRARHRGEAGPIDCRNLARAFGRQ